MASDILLFWYKTVYLYIPYAIKVHVYSAILLVKSKDIG